MNTRTPHSGSLSLFLLALIVGCDVGGPMPRTEIIEGVEHVFRTQLSRLGADNAVWSLDTVLIAGLDEAAPGEDPLVFQARTMTITPAGGYVVVDGGPRPFVELASDGAFVRRFGSWGQGPQEVNSGWPSLVRDGSDLLAVDLSNRKIIRFSEQGEWIEETPFDTRAARVWGEAVAHQSGRYFVHSWYTVRDEDGSFVTLGDSVRQLYPELPVSTPSVPMPPRVPIPEEFQGGAYLFSERQVFAALTDGAVVTGSNYDADLRVYRGGVLERVLHIDLGRVEISELEHRDIGREFASVAPGRQALEGFTLGIAEAYPLFTRLHGIGDSIIGMEHSERGFAAGDRRPSEDARSLRLFSRRGAFLGQLHYPQGFMPAVFLGDDMIGVRTDLAGRTTLEHYRLVPPAKG